ncbi:MAG: trimeric autotransporter adhesin [Mucilaginibacter sp.]|nr:trimeric autotransporter adhesin [Mucilaginibacter sp.]
MKARILNLIILFTIAVSISSAYGANTYTWQGGATGSWNVASNWTFNGSTSTVYPGSSGTTDIAVINTSNATITYTGTYTISQLQSTNFGVSGITISFTGTTPSLTITAGLNIAQPSGAAIGIIFSGSGTATITGTSSFGYHASMSISSGTTVTFALGSTIDFSSNQGTLTNNGTLNLTGCTFSIGSYSSFVSPGTTIANNTTFDINSTPGYITYAGKFVANSCIFNFPSQAYLKSTSTSSAFTATTSTFNLTGSGGAAYIYNNGTFRDHGSTYYLTGQGANIQNTGTGNMHVSGTTINFTAGSNAQVLNNTATFTADSATAINASTYTSSITNSGTFYAGTSGSACVITLGAQSASLTNTGTFYLGSTSIIYPTAVSTSVTNTSPGVFTLQSDANGSAAIAALNTSVGSSQQALCTGTFNVERYYQGSSTFDNVKGRWLARAYRIISSPVNTGTKVNGNNIYDLSYIVGSTAGSTTGASSVTNAFVTGATGGSTSAGNPTLYLFRENRAPSNSSFTSGNFIGLINIASASAMTMSDGTTSGTIPIGNGVLFFFRGAATNWTTRTKYPFIAPENVTLTTKGALNQQSVTVKDWYTTSSPNLGYTVTAGNATVRGFNMVGNPYPCTIDWETVNTGGITVTNINPTIYAFNPVTYQYDTYSSSSHLGSAATFSGKIASGQGFFVQGNNNNTSALPALTFNESAKAPTSLPVGSSLYMGTPVAQTAPQLIRLKLIIDSLNYDNTVVAFNSTASTKYNPAEDSHYLPGLGGAMESLSSFSADSVPLAINSLPLPGKGRQVIRLNVTGWVNGRYTLERTALDAIPQLYEVWLMDTYKKDSLDLRNNTTYAFNINLSDKASFGSNRFQVIIRQNPALGVHLLSFSVIKETNKSQISWTTENEQNYTSFTVQRSTDNGVTFDVTGGFVSSAQGTYSLSDNNPVNGTDLYRLKIEDLNGNITYSNVIALSFGTVTNANTLSVYPNPSNGVINLSILSNSTTNGLSALQSANSIPGLASANNSSPAAAYDIKIISITGAVIKSTTSASANWQDNVSSLTPGTYIIQVINKNNNKLVGKSTFVKI